MIDAPSSNTKAVLLLTAPLILGRHTADADLLSPGEYKRLAQHLRDVQSEPADLIAAGSFDLLKSCGALVDPDRLERLLGRGLLLSQAVDRWRTRAIQVFSRSDAGYPRRLKQRLRGNSPSLLYICGDTDLLATGGLAVVGSRNVDEVLVDYTAAVGALAAQVGATIVSGGARGIDQAAMRGALEAGGNACGVLADSLERQVMTREHRDMLLDGRLALVSPYDPNAGFNAGRAMQRNKLIYALADCALVVSSDLGKGGTWAGAVEQLEKLNLVPVYVRSTGVPMPGLDALRRKGALAWPNPSDADGFRGVLASEASDMPAKLTLEDEAAMNLASGQEPERVSNRPSDTVAEELSDQPSRSEPTPAAMLFDRAIKTLLARPMKEAEVADALDVSSAQVKIWLNRLVQNGVLEKRTRPACYALKAQGLLLD